MRRRGLFAALVSSLSSKGLLAQPVQTSTMYSPDKIRDDYTAGVSQAVFISSGSVRSNYVEVFKNGLLQRAGPTADYTGISVNNRYQVTFNPTEVPQLGDYVTLFYYR